MANPVKSLTVPDPVKRLAEGLVVLAVCAFLVLLIIFFANALVSRSTPVQSFDAWLAFIRRTDIIATAILAITVTMAVSSYRARPRR